MAEAKTHRLASWSADQVSTFCGLAGFRDRRADTEFDMVDGRRFEAVDSHQGVTCKRCAAAADKPFRPPVTLPAAY